jgi:hypothetical protein
MEIWLVYTLFATLLYGALNFLFKAAAERGHDADGLVNVVGLTVALMAFGTLLATAERPWAAFTWPVLVYALFNGLFFALGQPREIRGVETGAGGDRLSPEPLEHGGGDGDRVRVLPGDPASGPDAGLAAGLGVLGAITFEQRGRFRDARGSAMAGGILLALAGAFFTALSMTVGKMLADSQANRIAYIGASYTLVFFFTLGRRRGGPAEDRGSRASARRRDDPVRRRDRRVELRGLLPGVAGVRQRADFAVAGDLQQFDRRAHPAVAMGVRREADAVAMGGAGAGHPVGGPDRHEMRREAIPRGAARSGPTSASCRAAASGATPDRGPGRSTCGRA